MSFLDILTLFDLARALHRRWSTYCSFRVVSSRPGKRFLSHKDSYRCLNVQNSYTIQLLGSDEAPI